MEQRCTTCAVRELMPFVVPGVGGCTLYLCIVPMYSIIAIIINLKEVESIRRRHFLVFGESFVVIL